MLLAKLFWSKCRAKILEIFIVAEAMRPEAGRFFIRELAREISEQLNGVRRELMNLEDLGILRSYDENKKKVYELNHQCPFLRELSDMFVKNYDVFGKLSDFLCAKRTIDLVAISDAVRILTGLEPTPTGRLDMFLIGEIDRSELTAFLEKTLFGRKVKYAVMNKEEFLSRLEYGDKLALSILAQSGMRIVKDRLDVADIIEASMIEARRGPKKR